MTRRRRRASKQQVCAVRSALSLHGANCLSAALYRQSRLSLQLLRDVELLLLGRTLRLDAAHWLRQSAALGKTVSAVQLLVWWVQRFNRQR